MTTFATQDTERLLTELEARTRSAWATYRDELETLDGRAYEDAEEAAWAQLQAALLELETARAELAISGAD